MMVIKLIGVLQYYYTRNTHTCLILLGLATPVARKGDSFDGQSQIEPPIWRLYRHFFCRHEQF